MASITRRPDNDDQSELVRLRAAGAWAEEHGIERIDILKVDVEGAEVPVLESLAHLLPTVKVLVGAPDAHGDPLGSRDAMAVPGWLAAVLACDRAAGLLLR